MATGRRATLGTFPLIDPNDRDIASAYLQYQLQLSLEYIGQISEAWQCRASYSQFGNLQYAITHRQSLYLEAKNLLDTDSETPYLRNTFERGLPDRGRELTLGFRWLFD